MKRVTLAAIAVFIISLAASLFSRYVNHQNTVQKLKNVRSEQQMEAKRRLIDHE